MNKYRAIKTKIDGITFDSKAEARRYAELKLMEKAGEIKDLELQPKFELQEGFIFEGKKYQPIHYIPDFGYWDKKKSKTVYEDVKGVKTKEYQLKKKMFLHYLESGRGMYTFKEVN